MNARQTKKHLKKRIGLLEADNATMKRVISNSPTLQEMYDLYNKPLKVVHTPLQHYRICRGMAFPEDWDDEYVKQKIVECIIDDYYLKDIIKKHMVIEDRGRDVEFKGSKEIAITFDLWFDETTEDERRTDYADKRTEEE